LNSKGSLGFNGPHGIDKGFIDILGIAYCQGSYQLSTAGSSGLSVPSNPGSPSIDQISGTGTACSAQPGSDRAQPRAAAIAGTTLLGLG
jgi:hypothetical protein